MKNKKFTRRDFLRAAVTASGAILVASCATPTAPPAQVIKETVEVVKEVEVQKEVQVTKEVMVQPTAGPNAWGYVEWHPSEPVEIEFWGHNFNNAFGEGAQDRRTTDAFEALYPTIKVKRVNNDWGGAQTPLEKVAAAFAAGTGMPDVFIMHGVPDLCVRNGWHGGVTEDMMPTADRQRFGYREARLLALTGDDRVCDLTALGHSNLMFYRQDLLAKEGVKPEDFGDYLEDAIPLFKQLTKTDASGAITQAGVKIYDSLWLDMVTQAGATYFNTENKKFEWVNSDQYMYAVNFWRDLHNVHKVTSLETPDPYTGLPDGLMVTGQIGSWAGRWMKVNRPDADYRCRTTLKLKPAEKKGIYPIVYSIGLGLNPTVKDENKKKAAQEYWKYCYYNTLNQADLGFENFSFVTLKTSPDYEGMFADVPATGTLNPGQRTVEALYWGYETYKDLTNFVDLGMLWDENIMEPIWLAMLQEIPTVKGDLKPVVQKYQDQMQAAWDQYKIYVPGVKA